MLEIDNYVVKSVKHSFILGLIPVNTLAFSESADFQKGCVNIYNIELL
jgi:hypothetical protein